MNALLSILLLAAPAAPLAVEVAAEQRRLAGRELWPGFDPLSLPLAIFDGERTWLFRHPSPPEGCAPAEAEACVFPGRRPEVVANSSAEIGGVLCATLLLQPRRDATQQAAVAIHEAFHATQASQHAAWAAIELDLFTYPVDDVAAVARVRLEGLALRRAVATEQREEGFAWARAALGVRRERFARLPAEARAYEQGSELKEGLAQYVEDRASGLAPVRRWPVRAFAPDQVRARAYASGQALAELLDRADPGWKTRPGDRPLDERLEAVLPKGPAREFPRAEREAAEAGARRDVAELGRRRAAARKKALGAPGLTLRVVAGAEPLWPQGFDPLHIDAVGNSEAVHGRFVKLGNGAGRVEVFDRTALTRGTADHPLSHGVRELVVAGLPPTLAANSAGGVVQIQGPGLELELRGAHLEQGAGLLLVTLP